MNKTILSLERRKNRVLTMRSAFKWNCDKEDLTFYPTLSRFDQVLDTITKAIKAEWNKVYKIPKKILIN